MTDIVIFEPHGDDALLSCWPIFRNPDNRITLVTLARRSSEGLRKYFPNIVETIYYDCYEIPLYFAKAAYKKDFDKWNRDVQFHDSAWMWQRDVTIQKANNLWYESRRLTLECVIDFYESHRSLADIGLIVVPVGLMHPYHICVADILASIGRRTMYYAEYPYAATKWLREVENSHPVASDRIIYRLEKYSTDDPDLKERIFKDVYPTETHLLRFYHDVIRDTSYRFYTEIKP